MLPDDYDLPIFDGPTISFIIRYDPDSEEAALLFARRLFAELDVRIEALTLVPGDPGDFEVWLDDEKLHSGAGAATEPSARRSVTTAWARLQEIELARLQAGEEKQ